MVKNGNNYHVPNLDRTLVILDLLSKNPTGMNRNEIASASKCSTTMVYRIMLTLLDNGFVFRDEVSGSYRLSSKLLDIGCAGSDEYSLTHVAWPEMTALRDSSGMSVMLGSLYGEDEGLLLETAESQFVIRFVVQKGFRTKLLHTGAGWKSILAFLAEDQLNPLLDRLKFKAVTPNSITTREDFLKELQQIRTKGYATDKQEMTLGIQCVGAPIFDRGDTAIGTLTLSGTAEQMPTTRFASLGRETRQAADRVSAKLGWNGKVSPSVPGF